VPFEKFARSMAYLDSGEEAALAFAQVSTMVRFLVETKGEGVLPGVLDEVRSGVDAQQAVARAAGFGNFEEFRAGWVRWLGGLPLIQKQLAALPVVVDGGGDEFASDPLLAGRPDLARYTRLGDLLREAGRPRAAIVEYEKAADPAGPPSPLLLARKATCYEALGDRARALALVDEGVALYPEFTLLQVTRGRLLDAAGRTEEAVVAWSAAHDLNPYDPAVQAALVRGYEAIGDAAAAARHAGYARILATGGARP
jgi:tetratricopeptide (TPR) repeat protein